LIERLNDPSNGDVIFREEALKLAQERLDRPEDIWL